ncbi:LysR family transcriptional regulator [Rhizobium sp. 2YAF20]|uniref:LysR family transcriptional regulator n=1 Tax=Rhizobium sp. 2YAF20 TaxID=3233027 RepID=UPI003F9EB8B0
MSAQQKQAVFTQAAVRLGISKSGVAKSVLRLENRLGIRLFNRTTRRFALTADGQAFYEACAKVLADLEGAQDALSTNVLRPRGTLKVDLPVVFGRRWVLPILLDIADRYRELSMEVTFTGRQIDPIEEGVDLVLRIGDLADSSSLVARLLGIQKSVLCAAPHYIDRFGHPESITVLSDHSCIVLAGSGQVMQWIFADEAGGFSPYPVSGRLIFNDADAVCEAALAGQGIALLATWLIADHLRDGRLVPILPNVETRGFPIYAIWPRSRLTAPKVRVVIDELVARFYPRPPWNQD